MTLILLLVTLRDPGSFHLVSLLPVFVLTGRWEPTGHVCTQAGRRGGGHPKTPERICITSALVSRELSDLIMAHTQGVLSSVPVDAAEVALPLT